MASKTKTPEPGDRVILTGTLRHVHRSAGTRELVATVDLDGSFGFPGRVKLSSVQTAPEEEE